MRVNVYRIRTFVNLDVYLIIQFFTHVLCIENGKYDLTWRSLTSVPSNISSDAKELMMSNNAIHKFPKDEFKRFYQLEYLSIGVNPLSELPSIYHLAGTLKVVGFAATQVTTVPLMCPRLDLTMNALSNPQLTFCRCDNIWLKAMDGQHGTLKWTGAKACGAADTTAKLLEQECKLPQTGGVRKLKVEKKKEGYFCAFPVAKHVPDISVMSCAMICTETLGCLGFNFRLSGKGVGGDCYILAPTDEAMTDLPQDMDAPGWTYWARQF